MQLKFILGLLILVVTPQLSSAAACKVANCFACSKSISNYCAICNNNYVLNNFACVYQPGNSCRVNYCLQCEFENSNKCQVCHPFYKKATDLSGRCTPETCYDSNCFDCSNDKYWCDSCKLNYWSNLLGNCIQKCNSEACSVCNEISGEFRCTSCKKDYVLMCKLYIKI